MEEGKTFGYHITGTPATPLKKTLFYKSYIRMFVGNYFGFAGNNFQARTILMQ